MRGRKIQIPLPSTGPKHRKRNVYFMRGVILITLTIFLLLQLHAFNYTDSHDFMTEPTNDSTEAILSMVPAVFHKFLQPKSRDLRHSTGRTRGGNSNLTNGYYGDGYRPLNITEIKHQIEKYNDLQMVLNEDTFGPLQNDSVIILIQVHIRITYLRHLIVSLAQARDISKAMLIFSHDYYDEEINDLVQSIDFCKVMQIFYPYSIQTHLHEFPGVDPNDCPRDIKMNKAISKKCNNALHPDLYGHYREAKFTQTKHHWWWKVNRVFDQLEVTRYHSGLVVFLEEDHYVAEDFLYLLQMMQNRSAQICPQCNILSLGTYLKTFNYYTYSNKKPFSSQYASAIVSTNNLLGYNRIRNPISQLPPQSSQTSSQQSPSISSKLSLSSAVSSSSHMQNNNNNNNNAQQKQQQPKQQQLQHHNHQIITKTFTTTVTAVDKSAVAQTWSYHVLPSLYSVYQKVEILPWISSKHNMGFAFNRSTWNDIHKCSKHFCSYDDYNWDWSLQHTSQQCLKKKLTAMILKGPRVFHIGECGVHHTKKNCESNQVISKVQQVLKIARKSGQMYPRSLSLIMSHPTKKMKLRKGNGGWGDNRDHELCRNMTMPQR